MRECASTKWVRLHSQYPHDDFCLIWPFARKGGGYAQIGSDGILLHRLMCEYRNGPAPTSEHYATHSCGRGHEGCINPNHLRWRTPAQNQLERYEQEARLYAQRRLTAEEAAQ